jgi:N6-L-threonylcarbamoyladenine synthase
MKILAFETSCDDTSIAIFENQNLIAMNTDSQIKIHNKTWGVVPEVAAREHANVIFDVLQKTLDDANCKIEDINYIWVTTNPGLLPSLLTGTTVASTISITKNIPIIPINHIQAHIFANFLERNREDITFPAICLTVSGWHNDIYAMKDMWDMEKIWSSWDDAGGEAFDKVAKMMWLGYPGGPIISKLSAQYEEELKQKWEKLHSDKSAAEKHAETTMFPRVWLVKKEHNFSFSGLKSSVKREVDNRISANGELSQQDILEISYEFECAVTEVLAYKLVQAAKEKWVKTILLAGGVSANNRLKDEIAKLAQKNNLNFQYPTKLVYCMDNAAMVWMLTYYKVIDKQFEEKIWVVKV